MTVTTEVNQDQIFSFCGLQSILYSFPNVFPRRSFPVWSKEFHSTWLHAKMQFTYIRHHSCIVLWGLPNRVQRKVILGWYSNYHRIVCFCWREVRFDNCTQVEMIDWRLRSSLILNLGQVSVIPFKSLNAYIIIPQHPYSVTCRFSLNINKCALCNFISFSRAPIGSGWTHKLIFNCSFTKSVWPLD